MVDAVVVAVVQSFGQVGLEVGLQQGVVVSVHLLHQLFWRHCGGRERMEKDGRGQSR